MSRENVEILRRANEAFNGGDVEGFLRLCTDDVEIEDLNNAPDLPRTAHGIDEVRETLAAWVDAFDDFRGDIAEYIEAGDHVACVVDYSGKDRTSGLSIHQRLADLWRFRAGKLARGTLGYRNAKEALKAAGLVEQARSQENVEIARRGYAALSDAYRADDINAFLPILQEFWDPEVVFVPAGVLPEGPAAVQGWDGVLQFIGGQMQAFEKGTMWMEPLEYLDVGDRLVVPYRFGGRARHTGIEMEFSFVHVFTMRDGKVVHAEALATKSEALEAVGLKE